MLNVGRWRSLLIARQTRNPVPNGCAATLGLLLFLAAIAGGPRRALAQSACPGFAASRWVGTLTLSGRGSTTVGDVSVTAKPASARRRTVIVAVSCRPIKLTGAVPIQTPSANGSSKDETIYLPSALKTT